MASLDGFVYILKQDDLYKIGSSNDVLTRMNQINQNVVVEYIIPSKNAHELEKQLHSRFSAKRFKHEEKHFGYTEWFSLSTEDLSQIKQEFSDCDLDSAKINHTMPVKLYKADVELMKEQGKYGETLADIFHRIVEKGNANALPSA